MCQKCQKTQLCNNAYVVVDLVRNDSKLVKVQCSIDHFANVVPRWTMPHELMDPLIGLWVVPGGTVFDHSLDILRWDAFTALLAVWVFAIRVDLRLVDDHGFARIDKGCVFVANSLVFGRVEEAGK